MVGLSRIYCFGSIYYQAGMAAALYSHLQTLSSPQMPPGLVGGSVYQAPLYLVTGNVGEDSLYQLVGAQHSLSGYSDVCLIPQ